jgi:hypothetical protein
MTQVPSTQPLSRRERRAMEQAGAAGTPAEGLAPVAWENSTPLIPIVPEPPAPPMSRRERRLLEMGEGQPNSPVETQAIQTAPPAAVALPPVFASPASAHTGVTPVSDSIPVVSTSRVVGDITSATSSLIIPHTPTIDIAGPLGDTGEVVVTGQIRLPSSVSERGTIPTLVEDRDDDEAMDDFVTGVIPTGAKPVRASQAVSGKGDDTDIILVRRARWGTAAVVTSLGAAVLGLAAVALLVLALLTDTLG